MARFNSEDDIKILKELNIPRVDRETLENQIWFEDDNANLMNKIRAKVNFQFYRHNLNFNQWYYLEAFIFHVLYFGILGPFILIPGLFYWPYLRMMFNMDMFGGKGLIYWMSIMHWFCNIMILLCRFHWEIETVNYAHVYLAAVVLLIRCSSISAKYATYSSEVRAAYMGRYVTPAERSQWLIGKHWAPQEDNFVEQHINYSMRRKYIDQSTFKISFLEEPSQQVHGFLTYKPADLKGSNRFTITDSNVKVTVGEESIQYYDARAILYQLFLKHKDYMNKGTWKKNAKLFYFIVCIFFTLCVLFGRLYSDLSACGYDPIDIVAFWLPLMFISFLAWGMNNNFFFPALNDLDRIDWCLEQLSQMYSVTKIEGVDEKIFPTINLADAISIQSWLNCRKIVYDYGRGFHDRHKTFITILMVIPAISFLLVISHKLFFKTYPIKDMMVFCWMLGYVYVVYGIELLILVRKTQCINENYDQQTSLIRMNQTILQCMHHFRDYYVKGNNDLELPFNVNEVFTTESRSTAHSVIMNKLRGMVGSNVKQLDEYVEKLVAMQTEMIGEINRQDTFHPRTIFGFRINGPITGAVAVVLVYGVIYAYLYVKDTIKL